MLYSNQMGSILQVSFLSDSMHYYSCHKTLQKLQLMWSKYSTLFFLSSNSVEFYKAADSQFIAPALAQAWLSTWRMTLACLSSHVQAKTQECCFFSLGWIHHCATSKVISSEMTMFCYTTSATVQFSLVSYISCPLHLCVFLSMPLSRNELTRLQHIRSTVFF